MAPSTGSVPSAEMIRILASTVADVTGSCVEPEVVGAFEGRTCGSDGIVGNAGGPRLRPGGGSGSGKGNWASASSPHRSTVAPAASRRTIAQVVPFELRSFFA